MSNYIFNQSRVNTLFQTNAFLDDHRYTQRVAHLYGIREYFDPHGRITPMLDEFVIVERFAGYPTCRREVKCDRDTGEVLMDLVVFKFHDNELANMYMVREGRQSYEDCIALYKHYFDACVIRSEEANYGSRAVYDKSVGFNGEDMLEEDDY